MDIIDVLLEDHAVLRGEAEALTMPFTRILDRKVLLRDTRTFFTLFKTHEAVEDDFLSEAFCLVELDAEQRAEFSDSRESLAAALKLFGSFAYGSNGKSVESMGDVSRGLLDALEAHLTCEEKTVFPKLKASLRPAMLRDLGERARAGAKWADALTAARRTQAGAA
jgi:hypothetical protein